MRPLRFLPSLLLSTLLLSGCLGEEAGDGGDGLPGEGEDTLGNATLPQPMHWEADILVGADPFNFAPDPSDPTGANLPPCSQDVSACDFYDFTVNGTTDVTATLVWGVAANDLDLYLYQGDTQLSSDGINAIPPPAGLPATSQVLRANVPAGTYTFWVVVWNGAADSYTLDATFA